jgi:hypothetical protein
MNDVCVSCCVKGVKSKLQESPALLCESPKSRDPGSSRRHVIRAKNLPKHAIFPVVRPALPQYSVFCLLGYISRLEVSSIM